MTARARPGRLLPLAVLVCEMVRLRSRAG